MRNKWVIGGLAVLSLGISISVQANSYNQGFIAAESGDYKSAMQQWGPLAEDGHAVAQFNLAMLYHSGSGLPMNETEAVKWYIKSAENGYPKAQEYLAAAYREGWFGLEKDLKKAEFWENKLTQQ